MKFNDIITEAIIDNADIPKTAKNILKYIFNEYANDHDMGVDRSKFLEYSIDLSKKFAISIVDAIKLIEFYEKYKDVFFRDDMVQDYIPEITHDNSEAFLYSVHEYLYEKYDNKDIYDSGRVSADCYFFENPFGSYESDMLGSITAGISVNFSDIDEFTKLGYGSSWIVQLHMGFDVFAKERVGYDIIDMEELISDVTQNDRTYKNLDSGDVFSSGWIKSSYFNPPKYFTKEEVESFGERVIDTLKKIIRKHHHELEGFGDWLKHGGDVFENYKNKLK